MRPFLTADWTWLANITYAVDPSMLGPYLPKGLELYTIDGKAFVSLVPFNFHNTRVRSMRIPFHVNFPEMNLRFYVKHGEKRGVVFIREYVPKFMVAFIANAVYGEQYRTAWMRNTITRKDNEIHALYELSKQGRDFSVGVSASDAPYIPGHDSLEHFFKEHDLGFSSAKDATPYIWWSIPYGMCSR